MYWVTSFCQRAVWLRGGRVEADGEADRVVTEYQRFLLQRESSTSELGAPASGSQRLARFRKVALRRADGRESGELHPREEVTFLFEIETIGVTTLCHVGLAVLTLDGRCVFATSTQNDGLPPFELAGRQEARLHIPSLPLAGGDYTVKAFLLDESGLLAFDQETLEGGIRVLAPSWALSVLVVDHQWTVGQ
jgi:lipopolysaccharide transport system ATP-binding protein